MANPVFVRYIKDKAAGMPAALPARHAATWQDYMAAGAEMDSAVIMTGSTGQFGSATGVINQNTLNRVAAYQQAVDELMAEAASESPSSSEAAGISFCGSMTRV